MSDFDSYRKRTERVKELEAMRDLVCQLIAAYDNKRSVNDLMDLLKTSMNRIDQLPGPNKTNSQGWPQVPV